MGSYLLGFFISGAIIFLPIFLMAKTATLFISVEAILIVIGGTIGIAVSSYPPKKIMRLIKIIYVILQKDIDDGPTVVTEIINLAKNTRGDRGLLEQEAANIRFPFLRDGVYLIIDKMDDELETLLTDRIRTQQENNESIVNMIKSLGRFPPALGLLATVLSLIVLLDGIGGSSQGMGTLGPSMAVGLVGTLYGIIMANLVFSPMAENLAFKSNLDIRNRQIAMVGILLLKDNKSPVVVQETLNSMLDVSARVDVLGLGTQSTDKAA